MDRRDALRNVSRPMEPRTIVLVIVAIQQREQSV